MTDPDGGGAAKPCDPGAVLNTDASGIPRQNGFYDARFTCNIPRSAVDGGGNVIAPVRTSMYGHGLFGDYTEVHTRDVRTLGNDHGVMTCATDFIGMSEDDVFPVAIPALSDLSKFKPLADRLQQGFLDFLYLGRAMIHPDGFASNAGLPVQRRAGDRHDEAAVLLRQQPGRDRRRRADGDRDRLHPLGALRAGDELLDAADPQHRLRGLRAGPLPDLPGRVEPAAAAQPDPVDVGPRGAERLRQPHDHRPAAGDARAQGPDRDGLRGPPGRERQTEVEARTIGAPLRIPAVDANRLQPGYDAPFVGLHTLGDLSGPAAQGSGFFIWDIGPKRPDPTTPDPATSSAPTRRRSPTRPRTTASASTRTTRVIRNTPAIRAQIASFIDENGSITDPCGPNPCYEANWDGALP